MWQSPPLVDTVDKMQGQEADAVIVSYGVSDPEFAMRRGRVHLRIESSERGGHAGRSKCIVCLPRPLLDAPPQVLDLPEAARGLAYMRELVEAVSRVAATSYRLSWTRAPRHGVPAAAVLRPPASDAPARHVSRPPPKSATVRSPSRTHTAGSNHPHIRPIRGSWTRRSRTPAQRGAAGWQPAGDAGYESRAAGDGPDSPAAARNPWRHPKTAANPDASRRACWPG